MKTIGYIYRYNKDEQMGILAYGHKSAPNWVRPILFTKAQCITPIETGQLVYFKLSDDKNATDIERASLLNIKKDVIEDFVSYYIDDSKSFKCYDSTHIFFEDISKQRIKAQRSISDINSDVNEQNSETEEFEIDGATINVPDPDEYEWIGLDDDDDDEEDNFDPFDYYWDKNYQSIILPLDIKGLFSLFGDYNHYLAVSFNKEKHDTVVIPILDISFWFDKKQLNELKKTINAEYILYLFDLFEKKIKYARVRRSRNNKDIDKRISIVWRDILSIIPVEELKIICRNEPMLQPALPAKFCLDNIELLSKDYGFPSEKTCEEFYRYIIKISTTTTKYLSLCEIINEARKYKKDYNEEEGYLIFNLKDTALNELINHLENRFLYDISYYLGDSLSSVSNNKIDGRLRVQDLLNNNDKDYLIQMGKFLDFHNEITYIPIDSFIRRYISDFESLRKEDKDFLTIPVKNKVKEIILTVANDTQKNRKPYLINHLINEFSSFINTSQADLLKEVKNIVNLEFSNLDNLDDLKTAYDTGMISQDQYFNQYKNITKDYSINSLLNLISSHDNKGLLEQEYLISKTFSLYNVSSINEYKYISLGYGYISNLKELFKWFKDKVKFNYIDIDLWRDKEKQLTENLSKEDRWLLFEEGLIYSPLLDNLREHLDKAYQENSLDEEVFKKDCFQEIMVDDVVVESNNAKVFMILDNLDNSHKIQAKERANEQLNFFIWAYNPDENVDWEKINNYFYLLPYKQQIHVFRYIFYLKAKGKISFSVSQLSGRLTKNDCKLCPHLQLVLLFLTKKAENMNTHIYSNEIEEILGRRNMDLELFFYKNILLSFFSDFFYECHGYLLPSTLKPHTKYYYRNGQVEKVKKDGQVFYVIKFYDVQLSYDFERERFASTSPIFEAMDVLERNFPYKLYGDKEYWISADYEYKIKDFVRKYNIDDSCGLFDDQDYLFPIHQNWPARHKFCKNILCKRTIECYDNDPIYKIQFCWCDKQPCTRIGLFLEPIDNWKDYKFADLLDIIYNMDFSLRNDIWKANAEISHFINKYLLETLESGKEVISDQINLTEEIGEWNDKMSIITDEYPIGYHEDFEDDDYSESDDDYSPPERPSYGKYAGTYAQDEMGLSDDDIDTIYEGDPNAAWNND